MTLRRAALGLLLAILGGTARAAAPPDGQDLLILAPTRPLLVRLRIAVDGRPFRDVWQRRFAELFAKHDADADGRLALGEALQLAGALGGDVAGDPVAAAALDGLRQAAATAGGTIQREALRDELARRLPPLVVRPSALAAPRAGPALFPLLDADGDGRLARGELSQAERRLAVRDFDDNLAVSQQELVLDLKPIDAAGQATASAVLAVDDPARAVKALLARYDRDRDGKLTIGPGGEALLGAGVAALCDADADGALNAAELPGLVDREPDLELPLDLGRARSSVARRPTGSGDAVRARRKLDGGYQINSGDALVSVHRNNRDPAQADSAGGPMLGGFDADGNGYLDEKEIRAAPRLGGTMAQIDADGDGKVYAAELREFVERQNRAAAVRLVLTVADHGQDLFKLADEDGDGVLSHREQKQLPRLVETDDRDGDGQLGGGEIPLQLTLELARGSGGDDGAMAMGRAARSRATAGRADTSGPGWFRKMDRNGDGDLSPVEFLGPAEVFARLDADRDGLVSADEAKAGE